jgi:hypothetical protein
VIAEIVPHSRDGAPWNVNARGRRVRATPRQRWHRLCDAKVDRRRWRAHHANRQGGAQLHLQLLTRLSCWQRRLRRDIDGVQAALVRGVIWSRRRKQRNQQQGAQQ